MPENVIMLEEKRSFVDKAKQKMEDIRTSYKEKFVDTGKAQKLEEDIEKRAKMKKKTIKILGRFATIALALCPADGPFGEICAALATPGLCALVDIAAEIQKKAAITGKRAAEKYILKVDGSNGNVAGYNLNNDEIIEDITSLKEAINEVSETKGMCA